MALYHVLSGINVLFSLSCRQVLRHLMLYVFIIARYWLNHSLCSFFITQIEVCILYSRTLNNSQYGGEKEYCFYAHKLALFSMCLNIADSQGSWATIPAVMVYTLMELPTFKSRQFKVIIYLDSLFVYLWLLST